RRLRQPPRQLRRLVGAGRRRNAEAIDLSHRYRRRGGLDAGFAERDLPVGARGRRVPERGDEVSGWGERRKGEAAAGRLGILGQFLPRRQVAGLQPAPLVVVAPALPRQLCGRPVDPPPARQPHPAPPGKCLVFTRPPSSWSRRHCRGSYAAALWIADLPGNRYTPLLADERYN